LRASDKDALTAAQAWWQWESDLMAAETPSTESTPGVGSASSAAPWFQSHPAQALQAARIGVHYARAGWFLQEGHLLAQARGLMGLPGLIVQGQRDLITPPAAARALHRAWPGSRLVELPSAGHASTHPAMASALVAAAEMLTTLTLAQTALPPLHQETSHV
jgi:proline iminopeptidase